MKKFPFESLDQWCWLGQVIAEEGVEGTLVVILPPETFRRLSNDRVALVPEMDPMAPIQLHTPLGVNFVFRCG